ncbi:MAG: putative multidrug resistance ABC transporter ATP-binding/permease protein YheI [Bacteroidia bacterium]|nr:putative multidrug resistance ABC transporter ATP-binding/permease protein YheI [Bacteroidia bacterium]
MKHLFYLNKYFLRYKWLLGLGILFVTISNLFAIFPAQIIRHAFDVVAETISIYQLFKGFEIQSPFYDLLAKTLLIFGMIVLALALLKGVFMFFMRQTIIVMSRHIEYDMKNDIYEQYQKLSLAFFKRNNTGDLMARISEDVSRARMYVGPAIMYSINLVVLAVLCIWAMLSVNAELTLYVLLPLPFLSIAIYYVSTMIDRKSEQVQAQLSRLSTFVQETFSGIRVIKAYTREKEMENEFIKETNEYKDKSMELVRINSLFFPIMLLLIGLSTLLTIYIGGKQVIAGKITSGNIAEFILYINMLTWPFTAVGWVTSIIQRAAASQRRINEFMLLKPEIENPSSEATEVKGEIVFDNVSFVYPDSGIQALKNVSFKVETGKSLAVIGRTGSGKSTIAALITRLYDTTKGNIFIDGKNIRESNLYELRKQTGYVPQEVFLFSDSVFNNIAFGIKPEHFSGNLKEAVEQAAKDAAVYENIMDFPAKFDTMLGERGITLSGGQKQRVSIARAIIQNPRILIFDDCLSAVDTETEEKILGNLRRIMKGKTSVIISHRVSSVKDADTIIVLDSGEIIERGTHQNLMQSKGAYYELYQKQLLEEEKTEAA